MQYSGPGFVRVRGVPALRVNKITFALATNNEDVDELNGGGGHSNGPRKITVTVEGGIPMEGMEVRWDMIAAAGLEVPLDFVLAGEERQCEGDIRDFEMSTLPTGNSYSWTYKGRWLNWSGEAV